MRASADLRLVCTMTEDAVWWLALLARPKWGPARVLRGVEVAGSPQEAWDRWFLREPSEAMAGRDTARRWLEAAHSEGMQVCTLDNPSYPSLLRKLTDAMAMPGPDVDALWQAMADHTPWVTKRRDHGVRVPVGCVAVWGQVDAVHPRTERALATAAKLPLQGVRRQLFTLEFQGWVLRLPGRRYLRR